MYSDNLEYARQRLNGTIVMYDKEPVLVEAIDKSSVVTFIYLVDGSVSTADLDNLDLVGQNKLGYVNVGDSSYHVVRKPLRGDWRQGIRMANLAFTGREGFNRIPHKAFRNTIVGEYPPFDEAVDKLKYRDKVAFSRDFAVGAENKFFYREMHVGSYDKLVSLHERYKYLTEYLNDILEGNYAFN
jgi:hypothetical protein